MRATAAAAGGCVLLRTAAAERARIPDAIRHAVIDDVALARAVKRRGGRIWLGLADRVDSVRPYPGLTTCGGWSRAAPTRSSGTARCCSSARSWGSPWCIWSTARPTGGRAAVPATVRPLVAGGLAWLVMAGTYLPMLRYYRQPLWLAPLLPFTALLYLLMTVDSAVQHYRGRGAAWKGRTYTKPERKAGPETARDR